VASEEEQAAQVAREQSDLQRLQQWKDDETRVFRSDVAVLQRKLDRYRSKYTVLLDAVREATEKAPDLAVPSAPPRDRRKKETRTAVLQISDTQLGKRTATYNMDVGEERILQAGEKAIRLTQDLRPSYRCDEVRVYFTGDLVEGERIFPTQAHLIESSLLRQAVVRAPSIFAKLILLLLGSFRRVETVWVPGNHGRDDKAAHPETNWDTVVAELVKAQLLGSDVYPRRELVGRLTFNISHDFYAIDTMPGGWKNLIVHGHQIRGGFAGIPHYGVQRATHGWFQSIPSEGWDYLWASHFHQTAMAVVNYTEWRLNGTTQSADDPYVLEHLKAAGYPMQRLAYFNEDVGLAQESNLYLVRPGERGPVTVRFGGSDGG